VLDPREKQLKDMDPTVAALPDAQRAWAQQIRQRLATLNDARRNYAQAVGEGAVAPSAVETDLQKQIDDLKARYDERQANLSEQAQKTVGDERARELSDAQQRLDADKKALDAAKNAYDEARVEFDNQTARQRDAQAALGSIQIARDQLKQQTRALEAARHDRQQTQAEADLSFDIKPFTESDVTSTATDPRRDYCTYAIVGLAVLFAFLVLAASQPSSGETSVAGALPAMPQDREHDPDDDTDLLPA
jgi:DNA repair exonuclease SbcCD ATPase subunit